MRQNPETKASQSRGDRASGRPPRWSSESGQALFELALLLPLLLLLTLGIIEFGRLAYYSIEVASAARSAAQYGTQSLADAANTPNIIAAAQNDVPDIAATLTVNPQVSCGCAATSLTTMCPVGGCTYPLVYLTVTTHYTLTSLFHYPGIPASFDLTGNAAMPVRQ